jgi:hypothetical protein
MWLLGRAFGFRLSLSPVGTLVALTSPDTAVALAQLHFDAWSSAHWSSTTGVQHTGVQYTGISSSIFMKHIELIHGKQDKANEAYFKEKLSIAKSK